MSSFTLSFSGKGSILHSDYFPPIELKPHHEYVCGLVDFQTYNSIPNVTESNNKFYYIDNRYDEETYFKFANSVTESEEFKNVNSYNELPISVTVDMKDQTWLRQALLINKQRRSTKYFKNYYDTCRILRNWRHYRIYYKENAGKWAKCIDRSE